MAVFCLAVLLFVLGIVALLSLPQWGEDPVIPEVSVAPEHVVGLGDAVAVSPAQRLTDVAPAHLAGVEGPRLAVSAVAGAVGASDGRTGLASAQVVAVAVAKQPPSDSPQSPPTGSAPPSQAAPAPAMTPVSTPASPPAPVAGPTRPLPGNGNQPPPNPAGEPGPVGGEVWGPVEIYEGDEYAYSFSFFIQPEAFRAPGEDNMILRFGDEMDQSHSFGLQLWDDGSGNQRGIWASGDAMGGERFLAPVTEGAWHEVVLYFQASSADDGLYLLLLDGEPVDTRGWVSLIDSEGGYSLLEAGLFREGERVDGAPEVYFGPARLAESLEPVIP